MENTENEQTQGQNPDVDYDKIMAEQEAKLNDKTKGEYSEKKKPLIHKDKKVWDSADEMRIAASENHGQ